jgi:uncharacterized membrane protein YraQ (UPF0718 family)
MIYLNIILTILCIILIGMTIALITFWKSYQKTITAFKQKTPQFGDPNTFKESMKIIENLFNNKKN